MPVHARKKKSIHERRIKRVSGAYTEDQQSHPLNCVFGLGIVKLEGIRLIHWATSVHVTVCTKYPLG